MSQAETILIIILLIENVLVFLFILPRAETNRVSKKQLRKFIADNPDMFDAEVLEDITRIVQARMRERGRSDGNVQ